MKRIILLLLVFSASYCHADESTFQQADQLYKSQQYDSARVLFESMLAEDKQSAIVFFALGNCYYRLSDPVTAVYYYEKAIKLDPNNPDLKANIAFVRKQFKDKVNTDRSGISGWVFSIVNDNHPNKWSGTAVILINFAFLSLILSRFLSAKKSRIAFIAGSVALVLGISRLIPAWYQYSSITNHDQGIVKTDRTEIKSAPSENSSTVFILSEGTKVNITESNESWLEVNIGDANVGWIQREQILEI